MAKFRTYFRIGTISDEKSYLGISPDSRAGTVINTLDQNIVYRVELSNQRTIQSWTSKEKLSHKVVFDFNTEKYVGIFGRRQLCRWGEQDTEIPRAKDKLIKTLEEIISFDDKHTILVYEDGTCESLENYLEKREVNLPPIIATQTHKIINISCFNTIDNRLMLTYFVRNKKTDAMEFVYFLLNDDNLTPTKPAESIPRIKIARNEVKLAAFTVVKGEKHPNVMTIWSDKRIFMLPFGFGENTPSDFQFTAMFNSMRVDKSLTVVNVRKNCVAIYGCSTKQEGASLMLFNTRLHIVQCIQYLKVHLNNCRLWVIGSHIFMAVGQKLICAQFPLTQDKLSDNIGSKRSTEWNGQVNKDCINEESELEESVSFNREKRNGVDHTSNEEQMIQYGPQIFEDFDRYLRSLYHFDIGIDVVQDNSLTVPIKASENNGVSKKTSNLMKVKCAVHPKDRLYSLEEISLLEEVLVINGASEMEITEHLIPLFIEAKLSKELVIALRKYTNISERMLARSLKYFIDLEESDRKLAYINQVFACSFNKETIKEHLRTNLNLNNAIDLLEIIYRDLMADESLLEESPQYGHDFDGDMALINWFIVILDAHYQQFLLARDSTINDMILKWKTLIESFINDIREMKPITTKLTYLVNGKLKTNNNSSSRFYSVEKVKLY